MAVLRELGVALRSLSLLGEPAAASRAERAGSLAFYPAVGLALGTIAAAGAAVVDAALPALAGPAGVLLLVALSGARGARDLAAVPALLGRGTRAARPHEARRAAGAAGRGLALAVLAARATAAVALPAPARTTALLIAPMLGAWGMVVQCYGGAPPDERDPAAVVGRARFREFAWSSVVALGLTLAVGEPIGLVVVLAASLTTVAVRLVAYRWLGGVDGVVLGATRELVETAVMVALAILAKVAGR